MSSGIDPTDYKRFSIEPPFMFSKTIETQPSGVFQCVPMILTK